jgi:hypothetical protein
LKIFLQKNPGYKKEFELFAKTILPVEQVVFAGKSSIKKNERKPVFVSIFYQRTTYYAVAASLLLLLGLFFIFRNNETGKQEFADKSNNGTKTIVNVKKENGETSVKQEEQNTIPEKKEKINEVGTNNQKSETFVKISKTKTNVIETPKQEEKKEEIKLQPIIIEDQENPIAKEDVKPEMMKEEIIVEKKQENKKEDAINPVQTFASANTAKTGGDYQTVGSFARKKVRQVLGIKKSVECAEDKITVWDVAMAAKAKVQEVIGTKAVDVEKVCDGKGDSEYVFTAGNFSISRNAGK